jgi:hypothetical protein
LLSPCIFTNSIYFTPTNAHVKPLFCSFYCKMYPYTCFDPDDDPRIATRVGVHFTIQTTKKWFYVCISWCKINWVSVSLWNNWLRVLISGFRRDVDVICGLLGYYTASCANCLPTFRDNVSVPSSRVKIFYQFWPFGSCITVSSTTPPTNNLLSLWSQ